MQYQTRRDVPMETVPETGKWLTGRGSAAWGEPRGRPKRAHDGLPSPHPPLTGLPRILREAQTDFAAWVARHFCRNGAGKAAPARYSSAGNLED